MHLIENFKQKINPDINQCTKEYYVPLYVYHMNGPLKFNLSGKGITWKIVLCI